MKLTTERANQVYDILIEAGARVDERADFVYHHTTSDCSEWRFCGSLGFGGKYYASHNRVGAYPEDMNEGRIKLIDSINKKLQSIPL